MLGHSNLKQTSTYLNVPLGGLEDAMKRYDESRAACKLVASESPADHRTASNPLPELPVNSTIH